MKWLLIIFLNFSSISFAENYVFKKTINNDKDFIYFYLMFYLDNFYYTKGNLKDLNVFVKFENTKHFKDSNVVGECFLFEKNLIHIENKYWKKADFYDKKILFYHELGHCFFDKSHTPYSIMNSILLKGSIYKDREYHFINELFEH